MTAPHVFVSHSHQDDEFTDQLVRDLVAAGANVWVDTIELDRGDFMKRINDALASCEWLILVLSPASIQSGYVEMEVNAAINRVQQRFMKAVIPVLARPCDAHMIPPLWGNLHRYDATYDYKGALQGILRALGLIASPTPHGPDPIPSIPPSPSAGAKFVEVDGAIIVLPPCERYAGGRGPDGPAYQQFWLGLVTDLRKGGLKHTPSTIDCATYCQFTAGYHDCLYTTAFTGQRQARVAFDINRRDNKALFGALERHRETIDANFGSQLTWDRNGRFIVSRIYKNYPGLVTIRDGEQVLESVRHWMSDHMLKLQQTLEPWLARLDK